MQFAGADSGKSGFSSFADQSNFIDDFVGRCVCVIPHSLVNVYKEVRLTFSSRSVCIRMDGIRPYLEILALPNTAVDNVCLSPYEPTYGRRVRDTKRHNTCIARRGIHVSKLKPSPSLGFLAHQSSRFIFPHLADWYKSICLWAFIIRLFSVCLPSDKQIALLPKHCRHTRPPLPYHRNGSTIPTQNLMFLYCPNTCFLLHQPQPFTSIQPSLSTYSHTR